MARKSNRFNPKNVEAKRATRRYRKKKAAEELGPKLAAAGEAAKPDVVETEKPAVNVTGDITPLKDITSSKPPVEKGPQGTEGESIKRAAIKREADVLSQQMKAAKELTPAQVEEQNKALLAELPGAGTGTITPNPISEETLKSERELRPQQGEERVRPPRPASFTPVAGKTQPFTPLSQSQSATLPLTTVSDIESANESRVRRAEGGMGATKFLGMPDVQVEHESFGKVTVSPDLAEAHKLYLADYAKDPLAANKKALGAKEAKKRGTDFLHPTEHAGRAGGYQTLARVRMLTADRDGSMPVTEDHIKKYAKDLGLKYNDALTGLHNTLMSQSRSVQGEPESMANKVDQISGTPWLHPQDTWVHPETGQEVPVNGFHPDAQRLGVTDENGALSLKRAKGSVFGIYSDQEGKRHATNPVYVGWNRLGEAGKPGKWVFQGAPSIPEEHRVEGGSATPISPSTLLKSQLLSDKKMRIGSTQARKMISDAASQEAAKAAGTLGTNKQLKPYTGRSSGGEGTTLGTELTGYDVDETGATIPTPPKVGTPKGKSRKYIYRRVAPQLSDKTDPIKAAGKFVQVNPAPVTTTFSGRTVSTTPTEGPQPALGAFETPLTPKKEEAKPEQLAFPGMGMHGSYQFVGMPQIRREETKFVGAKILSGTESLPREDATVYSRTSDVGQEAIKKASGVTSMTKEDVQRGGVLGPTSQTTDVTFTPTEPVEKQVEAPAAPKRVAHRGNVFGQRMLPIFSHKDGQQWLGAIKDSDAEVMTAVRESADVEAKRARPVVQTRPVGLSNPPMPSKTLANIAAETGEAEEGPLPGAVKAAARSRAAAKPVAEPGRAGRAKSEVEGIPVVGA